MRYVAVTGVQTCALPILSAGAGVPAPADTPRARTRASPPGRQSPGRRGGVTDERPETGRGDPAPRKIGRASCRGRGEVSVVGGSFKKKRRRSTGEVYVVV